MVVLETIKMNETPAANDLWSGIGGHFDSFTQVICEFIDNSIANFEGKKSTTKTVLITLEEDIATNSVNVTIEDNGTGIDNFEPVFRLGDKTIRQSPLNEHGFGLKHALASANPNNNAWKIASRTDSEFKKGVYRIVSAPFVLVDLETKIVGLSDTTWPGKFNGPGTFLQFRCSRTLFNTLRKGIQGNPNFETCIDYLKEELGYVYAGIIEKGKANITIQSEPLRYNKNVEALTPSWNGYYKPNPGMIKLDLGGGELNVEYKFGEVSESTYVKHYKRNMSTSGVELRVNGRIVVSNVFKEIWNLEKHPNYNHFLVTINLVTQNRDALPQTRTSKNGIRSGDEKLETLYEWIRKTHPEPEKRLSGAVSEKELVEELADFKEKHIRSVDKHIEPEFRVFTRLSSPVAVDLYVFDGTDIVLYEAKKDTADVQNVYQLLMYWDGAVADGITPTEGILIASDFSPGVDPVLKILNLMKDQNGNNYKFGKKTWAEEKVGYPKP